MCPHYDSRDCQTGAESLASMRITILEMGGTMKSAIIRSVALASLIATLAGCTFYVGGKDAGTREAEESAYVTTQSTFLLI